MLLVVASAALAFLPVRSLPPTLGDAFSAIAAARGRGRRIAPAAYEELMLRCIEDGRGMAVYRLMEEAAADGMRLSDLSDEVRAMLARGLLPPEAEDLPGGITVPASTGASAPSGSKQLFTDPLDRLWVRPSASVRSFDCSGSGSSREQALASAWAAVDEGAAPVLFRSVGAEWPALERWTLPALCRSLRRAMVRVSPSSRVTFCRESHPDVQSGAVEPPSRVALMDVAEFAERLHAGRAGRPPLLYGDGERVYLQALAPYRMMRDVDFSFLTARQAASCGVAAPPRRRAARLRARLRREPRPPAPLGRLWVSAPGTVSPLHFDMTDSYLCQVVGRKRLLLWPSTALPALEPYPTTSPLARRLRVAVTGDAPPAGLDAAALERVSAPLEAVLEPGDVLWFPKEWAHHTEAALPEEGAEPVPSFSLGFRTDGTFLL
jgi:hypothetical protein